VLLGGMSPSPSRPFKKRHLTCALHYNMHGPQHAPLYMGMILLSESAGVTSTNGRYCFAVRYGAVLLFGLLGFRRWSVRWKGVDVFDGNLFHAMKVVLNCRPVGSEQS
jgi:hypothetical protein